MFIEVQEENDCLKYGSATVFCICMKEFQYKAKIIF